MKNDATQNDRRDAARGTARRRLTLGRQLPLEEESAVFILVNFADVVLTGLAFSFGAREVNVAANWILSRFDLVGMVIYKFVLVTFILLVCQYIHPTHPRTARMVLLMGSLAYGVLVASVTIALFRNAF